MKRTISPLPWLGLGLVVVATLVAACGSDTGDDEAVGANGPVEADDPSTSGRVETSEAPATSDPATTAGSSVTTPATTSTSTTTSTTTSSAATSTSRGPTGGGELTDVRPVPITSITPVGARKIDVVVEGGIEPCFIIDRIEVVESADRIELTVYAGSEPGAVCIQIVELHTATAELDDPIGDRRVIDGATGQPV